MTIKRMSIGAAALAVGLVLGSALPAMANDQSFGPIRFQGKSWGTAFADDSANRVSLDLWRKGAPNTPTQIRGYQLSLEVWRTGHRGSTSYWYHDDTANKKPKSYPLPWREDTKLSAQLCLTDAMDDGRVACGAIKTFYN